MGFFYVDHFLTFFLSWLGGLTTLSLNPSPCVQSRIINPWACLSLTPLHTALQICQASHPSIAKAWFYQCTVKLGLALGEFYLID